jgi:hypothetical protein
MVELNELKQKHQSLNDEMNKNRPLNDGSHTVQCPNVDSVCHCMADNCSQLTPLPHKPSRFCACQEAQNCCHFKYNAKSKQQQTGEVASSASASLTPTTTKEGHRTSSPLNLAMIGFVSLVVVAIGFVVVVGRRRFSATGRLSSSYERSGLTIDTANDADDVGGSGYRDELEEDEDDDDDDDVEIEGIEMTSSNESSTA